MRLLAKLFRRPPSVRDIDSLMDFIDANTAFLVQKGIYEYARARAGHYAKVLFGEAEFQRAADVARWKAYPIGLSMVGELVEGIVREHKGPEPKLQQALFSAVLAVFDRYPLPESFLASDWAAARAELERRLQLVVMHPRKPAKDIPEPFVRQYFECMPIHAKLRGADYPTTRNYLRITMCNIHDDLVRRMDMEALVAALRRQPS